VRQADFLFLRALRVLSGLERISPDTIPCYPSLMPPRILVVDDEPAVTELLAYNLRKAHYNVNKRGSFIMELCLMIR